MALHFARDEFAARQRCVREEIAKAESGATPIERGCNPIDREYGVKFNMTAFAGMTECARAAPRTPHRFALAA